MTLRTHKTWRKERKAMSKMGPPVVVQINPPFYEGGPATTVTMAIEKPRIERIAEAIDYMREKKGKHFTSGGFYGELTTVIFLQGLALAQNGEQ